MKEIDTISILKHNIPDFIKDTLNPYRAFRNPWRRINVIKADDRVENLERFTDLCFIHDQLELKKLLHKKLSKYYSVIINEPGFLYCPAINTDVILVAHLDTVHPEPVQTIYKGFSGGEHIFWSPEGLGGDDRCGIWMILDILNTTDYRPGIVLCEDEEIGGRGALKFGQYLGELNELDPDDFHTKFFIELDRSGKNDAVFYDCYNSDFIYHILDKTGLSIKRGSFSDISYICPMVDRAGVNISCGYYNEHSKMHCAVEEHMNSTISKVKKLLKGVSAAPEFNYFTDDPYEMEDDYEYLW